VNSNIKTAIFWVVLICVAVLLWTVVKTGKSKTQEAINFSRFLDDVENGKVKQVTFNGTDVTGDYKDINAGFRTQVPLNYPDLYKKLEDKKVTMDFKEANSGNWISLLVNASPFILLLAFWIFMMRQMQSGGNKALSFGKSRAPALHAAEESDF